MTRTLLVDAVGSRIAIDLTELDDEAETTVRAAWADATVESGEPVKTVRPHGSDRNMLSNLSQQVTLAAIEAARKWSFAPAMSNGQPAAGRVRVPVDFNLG